MHPATLHGVGVITKLHFAIFAAFNNQRCKFSGNRANCLQDIVLTIFGTHGSPIEQHNKVPVHGHAVWIGSCPWASTSCPFTPSSSYFPWRSMLRPNPSSISSRTRAILLHSSARRVVHKGAITSKIKHAVKHKEVLQDLYNCCSPSRYWTVRRHWLQLAKTKC